MGAKGKANYSKGLLGFMERLDARFDPEWESDRRQAAHRLKRDKTFSLR